MLSIKICTIFLAITIISRMESRRQLLIFADNGTNKLVADQLKILHGDPAGIADRDLVFKVILKSESERQEYSGRRIGDYPFTVILIGKDNTEKFRSHKPVALTTLYRLIDSMPMRKQEMKNKN